MPPQQHQPPLDDRNRMRDALVRRPLPIHALHQELRKVVHIPLVRRVLREAPHPAPDHRLHVRHLREAQLLPLLPPLLLQHRLHAEHRLGRGWGRDDDAGRPAEAQAARRLEHLALADVQRDAGLAARGELLALQLGRERGEHGRVDAVPAQLTLGHRDRGRVHALPEELVCLRQDGPVARRELPGDASEARLLQDGFRLGWKWGLWHRSRFLRGWSGSGCGGATLVLVLELLAQILGQGFEHRHV
ncbi:hypothetical protein GSI_04470 [Ganoderma sinense ZZ0214-1]|uniref:Uncharacterized protein n=1 Tax=Ganoderma sinense ZZ0214-1 TaxID=1077348 RepID=A0A2G8SGZ6_9APHY|nr:hypothetical protein GSI_04470 [Ganoderma sinense ZZ0214-1]